MTGAEAERAERRMVEVILGVFFITHGLVTAVIWAAPGGKDAPFDPAHSWLIGDTRTLALLIGAVVGLALVATGAGMIADAAWWPALAVVAGFAGIVLMTVWFDPWLILGLGINLAVLVVGLRALPGS
jgi:hypothetical protein